MENGELWFLVSILLMLPAGFIYGKICDIFPKFGGDACHVMFVWMGMVGILIWTVKTLNGGG